MYILNINTLRPTQNAQYFAGDISNAFYLMKIIILLIYRYQLSLFRYA